MKVWLEMDKYVILFNVRLILEVVQLRKSSQKVKVKKRMCHVQSKNHHFLSIYGANLC